MEILKDGLTALNYTVLRYNTETYMNMETLLYSAKLLSSIKNAKDCCPEKETLSPWKNLINQIKANVIKENLSRQDKDKRKIKIASSETNSTSYVNII